MEKIGDIIGKVVPALQQGRPQPVCPDSPNERITGDVESVWCRIVDENLRAHSYVECVKKDTLFVKVDSSCYLSALKMKTGEILKKLRDSGVIVRAIRFRM